MATLAIAVGYAMVADRTPRSRSVDALVFQRLDGSSTGLAGYRGQAVLLTVWATWCWSCRQELPALARLHRGLGGRPPAVIALSVDRDGADVVEPLLEQLNVKDLPVFLDPTGASVGRLAILGLPTTILLGSDGVEKGRWHGVKAWDEKSMMDEISALLAGLPGRQAR